MYSSSILVDTVYSRIRFGRLLTCEARRLQLVCKRLNKQQSRDRINTRSIGSTGGQQGAMKENREGGRGDVSGEGRIEEPCFLFGKGLMPGGEPYILLHWNK